MCFLFQIRYGYVAEAPIGAILVLVVFTDIRLALHYAQLAILFLGLVPNLVDCGT